MLTLKMTPIVKPPQIPVARTYTLHWKYNLALVCRMIDYAARAGAKVVFTQLSGSPLRIDPELCASISVADDGKPRSA